MARKSYWIKLLNSYLDDPKYMRLTDTAKAVYFELYMLASKSDAYGFVLDINDKPATIPDIAYLLHRDDSIVKLGMSELEAIEFISIDQGGVCVTRYADEQPNRDEIREQWRERQERHREKEKESSKEKEKDLNKDKDKDIDADADSHKHVTQESQNVTRDNKNKASASASLIEMFVYEFKELYGFDFDKTPAFYAMVERLVAKRVGAQRVRRAFSELKNKQGRIKDIEKMESWILRIPRQSGETTPEEEEKIEELRQKIAEDMARKQAEQPAQTEQTKQDDEIPF